MINLEISRITYKDGITGNCIAEVGKEGIIEINELTPNNISSRYCCAINYENRDMLKVFNVDTILYKQH